MGNQSSSLADTTMKTSCCDRGGPDPGLCLKSLNRVDDVDDVKAFGNAVRVGHCFTDNLLICGNKAGSVG